VWFSCRDIYREGDRASGSPKDDRWSGIKPIFDCLGRSSFCIVSSIFCIVSSISIIS
jgi:hypothetical protein